MPWEACASCLWRRRYASQAHIQKNLKLSFLKKKREFEKNTWFLASSIDSHQPAHTFETLEGVLCLHRLRRSFHTPSSSSISYVSAFASLLSFSSSSSLRLHFSFFPAVVRRPAMADYSSPFFRFFSLKISPPLPVKSVPVCTVLLCLYSQFFDFPDFFSSATHLHCFSRLLSLILSFVLIFNFCWSVGVALVLCLVFI